MRKTDTRYEHDIDKNVRGTFTESLHWMFLENSPLPTGINKSIANTLSLSTINKLILRVISFSHVINVQLQTLASNDDTIPITILVG